MGSKSQCGCGPRGLHFNTTATACVDRHGTQSIVTITIVSIVSIVTIVHITASPEGCLARCQSVGGDHGA